MPSSIIEAACFSGDVLVFMRLLAQHRVRYVIVGGEAVIFHGYPRVTGDIDFFYDHNPSNSRRLFNVLLQFWDGQVPGLASAKELEEEGVIFQFGRPPHRIDLMNRIDGVRFAQAWKSRIRVQVRAGRDAVSVAYIDLALLLKNKRVARRPKDMEDARYLSAQLRRRSARARRD